MTRSVLKGNRGLLHGKQGPAGQATRRQQVERDLPGSCRYARRINQKLAETNRRLSHLRAAISHDIKSQLTVLLGYLSLAGQVSPGSQRRHVPCEGKRSSRGDSRADRICQILPRRSGSVMLQGRTLPMLPPVPLPGYPTAVQRPGSSSTMSGSLPTLCPGRSSPASSTLQYAGTGPSARSIFSGPSRLNSLRSSWLMTVREFRPGKKRRFSGKDMGHHRL